MMKERKWDEAIAITAYVQYSAMGLLGLLGVFDEVIMLKLSNSKKRRTPVVLVYLTWLVSNKYVRNDIIIKLVSPRALFYLACHPFFTNNALILLSL